MTLLAFALLVGCIVMVVLPPKYDPAVFLKEQTTNEQETPQ